MYQISQFSKLSGLTVKALRYYDEQNILKPSYRNKDTLYRYYDESDLKKAQMIQLLRSLDFSITEVRETLEMAEDQTDLSYILREKITTIEENIKKEKILIKKINDYLTPVSTKAEHQSYKITCEEIPPTLVASIRFSGKYKEIGNFVHLLYKSVNNNVNGAVINCYYDEACMKQADMELCLPIKKPLSIHKADCKYLPAVTAVCTTHYGSYGMLHLAYKALFQYVNEQGITLLTPSREIYVKGPGMLFYGNPEKYITKIILPCKMPDPKLLS